MLGALAVPPFIAEPAPRPARDGAGAVRRADPAGRAQRCSCTAAMNHRPGRRHVHLGRDRRRSRPDRQLRALGHARRRGDPLHALPRRPGADPRADRPLRRPQLGPGPGLARRDHRRRGSATSSRSTALVVHVPRGDELTPARRRDRPGDEPDAGGSRTLAAGHRTGRATLVSGNAFAFPLMTDGRTWSRSSRDCSPTARSRTPSASRHGWTSSPTQLEATAVHLDTALLFAAFRDAATADERRRLAREMHDGIAQDIASLGYLVDGLAASPLSAGAGGAAARSCASGSPRVVGEVRRSVQSLRTEVGGSESLGTAIGGLARHLSDSSGIPIQVTRRRAHRPAPPRGRVRAAADRPGGDEQRRPARPAPPRSRSAARVDAPDGRDRGPATTAAGSGPRRSGLATASRSCASAPGWSVPTLTIEDADPHGTVRDGPRCPAPRAQHRRTASATTRG